MFQCILGAIQVALKAPIGAAMHMLNESMAALFQSICPFSVNATAENSAETPFSASASG